MEANTEPNSDLRDLLSSPRKVTLLQQILGSQTGALSAVELAARNNITEREIRDHLRDLEERPSPIVTQLDATTSEIPDGIPQTYFAVTEYGIDLLKQAGIYEAVGMVYQVYTAAALELPEQDNRPVTIDDIESFDGRPTPGWL